MWKMLMLKKNTVVTSPFEHTPFPLSPLVTILGYPPSPSPGDVLFERLLMNSPYVMHCAIWYYFYNLKNVKNTTKSNTPTWVIFTFFKLCKWYQIAQSITYMTPNSLTWKRIGSISELSFIWIFCTEYNKM